MLNLNEKLAELNSRNSRFWEAQSTELAQCVADDALLSELLDNLKFHNEGTPIKSQKTFESVLERLQKQRGLHRTEFQDEYKKEFAKKGGRTEKLDALQKLIRDCVCRNRDVSEHRLLDELRKQCGISCIYDIAQDSDGVLTIFFTEPDGKPGEAHVSGLKHRLSRAKKKLLSR